MPLKSETSWDISGGISCITSLVRFSGLRLNPKGTRSWSDDENLIGKSLFQVFHVIQYLFVALGGFFFVSSQLGFSRGSVIFKYSVFGALMPTKIDSWASTLVAYGVGGGFKLVASVLSTRISPLLGEVNCEFKRVENGDGTGNKKTREHWNDD